MVDPMGHREFIGGKLVRDRDPENIRREGKKVVMHIERDNDLRDRLRYKVGEEACEVASALDGELAGELADVRHALGALCAICEIKPTDVPELDEKHIETLIPKGEQPRVIQELSALLVVKAIGLITSDDDHLPEHVGNVRDVVEAITNVANVREKVREEMDQKLKLRGGFTAGNILESVTD